MIRYDEATKRYGTGPPAVDGLSLEVPAGETCVLVGPSGGGKTTALKMVNRLVEPTSGRVLIDGRDVASTDPVALRRGIGYVIQQVGLFPHLDVAANVATVPRLLGWERRHGVGERGRRRHDRPVLAGGRTGRAGGGSDGVCGREEVEATKRAAGADEVGHERRRRPGQDFGRGPVLLQPAAGGEHRQPVAEA